MTFLKSHLCLPENPFCHLDGSVTWESQSKGRKLAVLQRTVGARIPIVRTTTQYSRPAHTFRDCHTQLLEQIKIAFPETLLDFNNASLEIYDAQYTSMKYHSDQALDLNPNSYIALFSCYEGGDIKTFVNYDEETCQMHFENIDTDAAAGERTVLMLARTEEERAFFRRCKGQENRDANFVYPRIEFTLSESDLIAPV
jgi:hypothetical protein